MPSNDIHLSVVPTTSTSPTDLPVEPLSIAVRRIERRVIDVLDDVRVLKARVDNELG